VIVDGGVKHRITLDVLEGSRRPEFMPEATRLAEAVAG
jgi:hypothetical protein